jgi:hypothetical protein
MPITFSVDHGGRRVTAVATGPITMDDIRDHLSSERRDRGLAYREFIDASKASPTLNTADARATVNLLRDLGNEGTLGPTAIIVPNEVSYGIVRMVEILLEGIAEVRPFRTNEVADAKEWLEKT